MRACDIKIGEYLEFNDYHDRYGYLKAVGVVLANCNNDKDYNYMNEKELPYITVLCEHTAFSKHDGISIIRRIRPRDLKKVAKNNGKI